MIEEELINKAKENNQKAFTILYNKNYQTIYHTIFNIVKNEEITHDLANETFLKAFKNLDKYVNNLSFIAWLKTIAVNHTIDYLRVNRTGRLSNIEDFINILPDNNDPYNILNRKENAQELMDIIEDLPLKYQEIVQLKYVKELSNTEIAKAMNCSENSVKAYITRIKNKIKNKL